jgi:hypothetical protein
MGLVCVIFGFVLAGSCLFVFAVMLSCAAIRIFERAVSEPKTRGVHASFPFFVRLAYCWLLVLFQLDRPN